MEVGIELFDTRGLISLYKNELETIPILYLEN